MYYSIIVLYYIMPEIINKYVLRAAGLQFNNEVHVIQFHLSARLPIHTKNDMYYR